MKSGDFRAFGMGLAILITGCSTDEALLYTNRRSPGAFNPSSVTSTVGKDRVGEASSINVLGLISVGDNSLDAAMTNGGIRYVRNHDEQTFSLLNLFTKRTTIVYGTPERKVEDLVAEPGAPPAAFASSPPSAGTPATPSPSPAAEAGPARDEYYVLRGNQIFGPTTRAGIDRWRGESRITTTTRIGRTRNGPSAGALPPLRP